MDKVFDVGTHKRWTGHTYLLDAGWTYYPEGLESGTRPWPEGVWREPGRPWYDRYSHEAALKRQQKREEEARLESEEQ